MIKLWAIYHKETRQVMALFQHRGEAVVYLDDRNNPEFGASEYDITRTSLHLLQAGKDVCYVDERLTSL